MRQNRLHRIQFFSTLAFAVTLTSAAMAEIPVQRKSPTRLPTVTTSVKSDERATKRDNAVDLDRHRKPDWQRKIGHRKVSFKSARVQATSTSRFDTLPVTKPARWLRSTTSSAAAEVARRTIQQATQELQVEAWLSAEASAWEAMHWAAEAVDLAARENGTTARQSFSALQRLSVAETAIREARDFSGSYGSLSAKGIGRVTRSHQTNVLHHQSLEGITATDAADRYLDEARSQLARIAANSDEAVKAMDLLAAIYLGRADQKTFPSGTALCLRRAALQGQPGNASIASRLGVHLAAVGLLDEAGWALHHSLTLESDPAAARALADVLRRGGDSEGATRLLASIPMSSQTSQLTQPEIVQLSPGEFAAISKPVMFGTRNAEKAVVTLASSRSNVTPTTSARTDIAVAKPSNQRASTIARPDKPIVPVIDSSDASVVVERKPNLVQRMLNSVKTAW